jgi:hypothetical protein
MQTIEFRAKIKNGVIQIPARFKGKVSDDARVILVPKGKKGTQTDMIEQLMSSPLKVKGFAPLTREETHARK